MFNESAELREVITYLLHETQPSELEVVFSYWVEKFRWVLEDNGDYCHEETHLEQKDLLARFPERWRHNSLTP
jgi:hypothetical protein